MRSPIKHSKWFQPDEPDDPRPNPWFVLGYGVGALMVMFGLLALIG